ncbi:transcriptional regulator, partial [Nocardia sp. NPDC058497]
LLTTPRGHRNGGDLAAGVGLGESPVTHHLGPRRTPALFATPRRGMNTFHRARRDALSALCTVLDPNCCS